MSSLEYAKIESPKPFDLDLEGALHVSNTVGRQEARTECQIYLDLGHGSEKVRAARYEVYLPPGTVVEHPGSSLPATTHQ